MWIETSVKTSDFFDSNSAFKMPDSTKGRKWDNRGAFYEPDCLKWQNASLRKNLSVTSMLTAIGTVTVSEFDSPIAAAACLNSSHIMRLLWYYCCGGRFVHSTHCEGITTITLSFWVQSSNNNISAFDLMDRFITGVDRKYGLTRQQTPLGTYFVMFCVLKFDKAG